LITKRLMLGTFVVVLTLVVGLCVVFAQEATGGSTPAQAHWSLTQIIMASGWIGVTIILLSFIMVGLTIEHFINITDEKLIPPDFVGALQTVIDEKKYQEAIQLCDTSDNYISHIMSVGLSEIRYGYDAMVDSMAGIGEEESIKLQQKIGYLALIATLAPLLGLLGTVVGMVICFRQIAEMPVTTARDLAYGIYMALVTTVEGLIVAIPCLFVYGFFQNRVTNIGLEAGAVCEELIRRFKPVKVAGVEGLGHPTAARMGVPQAVANPLSQPPR